MLPIPLNYQRFLGRQIKLKGAVFSTESRVLTSLWGGRIIICLCLYLQAGALFLEAAGAPVVPPASVVNSASYADGTNSLAPGSIATIFGSNLNDGSNIPTSALGSNGKLITTLGGASVTFNGTISAPLFSSQHLATFDQLNVQIPFELAGASSATVVVTVGGQSSAPQTAPLSPFSPGIYALNSQGAGQGAIKISNTSIFAAPAGSLPGLQSRAVNPGEYISIYATGLGAVTNPPATGAPAPSSPLSNTITTPVVVIGGVTTATPSFSGLAPGFVGLYQIDVQVPAGAPSGSSVPVVVNIGGKQSNGVTIAIANNAGAAFKHVVVIFQENRTPDNLFQGLCTAPYGSAQSCSTTATGAQYDIQTQHWLNKKSATGVTEPGVAPLANAYDLDHSHGGFTNMCDANATTGACAMDGAAAVGCGGTCPTIPQFRYVDNSTGILNPYLQLATQYGWANLMFQTNQGPSFPAHQFIFGGTSAPTTADDAAGVFAAQNTAGASTEAGCTAPTGTTVVVLDSSGATNAIYPCFEHSTVADILPSSVTWRYYAPNAVSIWTAPNAIQHICQSTGPGGQCVGQSWTNNVDLKPPNVLNDITSCNLRSVSWVIPGGQNSDHAQSNDGGGPSWVASIVNAIGNSTTCDNGAGYWNDTAIFITWDDWGGWYDHEPPTILPKPEGDYQYGFRVPLVVVSASTPKGYISNTRYDFGSILRFVEHNFGIREGALNFADARATSDLTEFFNVDQAPRAFQSVASPKNATFFLQDKRPATEPDND